MSPLVISIIALVVVLVYAFSIYNSLIQKRISTDNAWSQIDVQLKRRHDLIPNLLETVKGYAAHEKETLERVVQARNSAMTASNAHNLGGQIQAEQALTGALRQVFALSESYPDLKANTNFQQLQEELTSTENRIGFARQAYNDAVALYMTAIEQIPGNLVRGFGSFPAKSFFELDPADATVVRSVPKVSF